MANTHATLASLFKDIADTIRAKAGLSDKDMIVADDFPDAISLIQTGGSPKLQSKTVSPSESLQTVKADSGYDGLSAVAINGISNTYVGTGVTRKQAATYTPGTIDQSISSGQYLEGKQTIKGDANLVPENIASGKTIFGVAGAHTCSTPTGTIEITANGTHDVADYASVEVNVPVDGLDTSETTSPASARDIAEGKIAFVNGEKVTGSVHVTTGTINILPQSTKLVSESTSLHIDYTLAKDNMYRNNTKMVLSRPLSDFGDAEAADVAAGKTFTSTAGLKATGTRKDPVISFANNVLSIK